MSFTRDVVFGGVAILVLFPIAFFQAVTGNYAVGAFYMAWAAFMVALSNHEV